LHPRASTAVLVGWLVATVVRGLRERRWPRSGFPGPLVAGPVGFYALHGLGMWGSSEVAAGWFALEVKLGLLAVPLLGSWEWARLAPPDRARIGKWMLAALGLGLALRMAGSLVRQTHAWIADGVPELTYAALSHPFHPSYLALYFTVWWILARPVGAPSVAVGGGIGLLQSRAGLLVAVAAATAGMCNRRWRTVAGLLLAGLIAGTLGAALLGRLRIDAPGTAAGTGSTGGRLQAWTAAVEVVREHPWGVGTGDVVPALVARYEAAGADYARVRRMNAHSTYLQTAVALGYLGLAEMGEPGARERAREITASIVTHLWDDHAGIFRLMNPDGSRVPVSAWQGLAPAALPDLPAAIRDRVVDQWLLREDRFWPPHPVPSVSLDDPSFMPGDGGIIPKYWRGPSWPFTPPFALPALLLAGRHADAQVLVARLDERLDAQGFREYTDPLDGTGMGARAFSCQAVVLALHGWLERPPLPVRA